MTTKPKRKTRAPERRCLTEAELAAMDFEPWQGEADAEKQLPDNEQFTEDGLGHLITCRFALTMMYRTKAELSEMFEQDGDAMTDLAEGIGTASDFFKHFSDILDAAGARLLVAGSSVCQNTPEKCGARGREWGSA